jgi:endonuclease-3 related protein
VADLRTVYALLIAHFGALTGPGAARPWWPLYGDDAPFEILVGAVLVQQTRWETVEAAVLRLLAAGLLSPPALASAAAPELAAMIRPAAFHTQKAPGLIAIARHIAERYDGSTAALLARPTAALRAELLALPRIGRETCDVTMLYGGGHAVFVVDEYTRRLFERVGPGMQTAKGTRQQGTLWRAPYDELRLAIEDELALTPPRPQPHARTPARPHAHKLYAEYHAQINEACVRYCLARPRCDGPPARRVYSRQEGRESYLGSHEGCPLRPICGYYNGERGEGG